MRHILNRSEQGAVFAADGYARASGRPGVALVISGPGVTNAATPIAQAYHDSIPLLIVSAVIPRPVLGRGWGALHELPDQHALMTSITAFSEHIEEPELLPEILGRAFELFASGRPRPVHLQVPADLLRAPAPPLAYRAARPAPRRPADADVAAAAALLAPARRPVVVLGGGAVDAGPEAARIAERLQAPVALTLNAKGTLADAHPLSLGTTLPCSATLGTLADADAVLAVGTELSEVDFYYADTPLHLGGALVRLDIDARQLQAQHPAAAALHGDAAAGLRLLDAAIAASGRHAGDGGIGRAAQARARIAWWPQAAPLLPLVETIGSALPEDAIVAVDSTQLGYVGQNAWPAHRARSWIVPSGWGTLGPALPMAIGAAVAQPERPVLCVVGDGGALYTIGEMAAATDLALPLTMLLWNNDGYEEMRDELDLAGIPHVGTQASAHDYQAIAAGFGWATTRPTALGDVAGAIGEAVAARRPTLVELTPALLG